MSAFGLIGFAAFAAASLSVGLRLLLVARRTRELPELSIGGALFGGGLGYCTYILAYTLTLIPPGAKRVVVESAIASLDLGLVALTLGTWRIFRAGSRWAAALFTLTSLATALHFTLSVLAYDAGGHRPAHVFWLFHTLSTGAYLWTLCECFRYQLLLRRRERVGLGEPELALRFRLWGCASSAALGMVALSMLNRFLVETGTHPQVLLAQSFCGLVSAVSIWLAFFPPRAYLRLVLADRKPALS